MIWLGLAVLVLLIVGSCTSQKPLKPQAEPSGLSEENLGSVDDTPRLQSQASSQQPTDAAVEQSVETKLASLERQTSSPAETTPDAPWGLRM